MTNIMTDTTANVFLGLFTFEGNKAIIHKIEKTISAKNSNKAEEIGEEMIVKGLYDSYIVPSIYKGEIHIKY